MKKLQYQLVASAPTLTVVFVDVLSIAARCL